MRTCKSKEMEAINGKKQRSGDGSVWREEEEREYEKEKITTKRGSCDRKHIQLLSSLLTPLSLSRCWPKDAVPSALVPS